MDIFAEFVDISRINSSGSNYERLFAAGLGVPLRGAGAHSLTQCGNYIVFAQGAYIYKMDLSTLKTDTLINGKDENTYIEFAVKDDYIYFSGNEGDFTDGIYKISINGSQPVKIVENDGRFCGISIYNDRIFYNISEKGLYRVNLDGSNKKLILELENVLWGEFIVSDGYIYYLRRDDYSFLRADVDGNNVTKLVDMCKAFIIRGECLIYTKLSIENNYYYGTAIYVMPKDNIEAQKIYEGDAEIWGSCGNWVYFTKPSRLNNMLRIRLDGSGEMALNNQL